MPARDPHPLNNSLLDRDIVAVVVTQRLRPVEGPGAPFFPPTYLGSNDKPTYCISDLGDGHNLCIVDSVQSQANRIETAFMSAPYRGLIRSVSVKATLADSSVKELDMLQLSHRLADAAVRFSSISKDVSDAIRSGPEAIARLSPMSLLCGMWDSRGEDSQAKIPRALSSAITAHDVRPLGRMATFSGSFRSKELGLSDKQSATGLDPVPTEAGLGGVVATGEIVRTSTLNLIALRSNCRVGDKASTTATYIHALGLLAISMTGDAFLRQGCLLVEDGAPAIREVTRQGREVELKLDAAQALAYAKDAAGDFGIEALKPIQAVFDPQLLKAASKSRAS